MKKPIFLNGSLRIFFEDDEVCIYGTRRGFDRLIELIRGLTTNKKKGHLHLDDYELLTKDSARCAVALFPETED